jgi:uncharacterized membrane protein
MAGGSGTPATKGKRGGLPAQPLPKPATVPLHLLWIPSAVGLAVSAYLFGLDLSGTAAFCLTPYGCESVRGSAYGRILGVPVAAVGLLFFGAALGLCLIRAPWRDRWFEILAGIGTGASVVFVGLQFAVIRAVCPYCLVAEAAAFALAYLILKDKPRRSQVRAGFAAVIVAVALSATYAWTSTQLAESEYASGLARHLTQSGAAFYGAYWCPHCQEQKAMFGRAAALLPYVECDPRGAHAQPDRCRARGIRAYPTWEFRGDLVEGLLSLNELARRSGHPRPPSNR